jgi:hypothetical protein
MIDDPVVLILCEAAARGRQLRLAREQAARSETRSGDEASETPPSEQIVNGTTTTQLGDDAVGKESST